MGINPAGIHVFFVDKHNSDKKTGKTIIMYLVFNQYKNTDQNFFSNKQSFVVIVCIIIEPMPLNICYCLTAMEYFGAQEVDIFFYE